MLDPRLHQQPVNHQFDGVVLALVQRDLVVGNIAQLTVDARAREALLRQLVELLLELAFAPAHDRRHDHHPVLGLQVHHALHNLVGRLPRDGAATLRTMRHADRRIQQAQVVVDLGDGADGGTRAAAGRLLLDGDRRAQAVDAVHIGPLHLVEELARVSRQRLHVAALPLGINGVEGERRLARAAQAGDNGQSIARNLDADVLQVVLTRPADCDAADTHG